MTNEPAWLVEARKHLGLKEVKGPQHAQEILQFWKDIKRGGIKDDETAWCAAFVGAMLERVGIRSSRFESAKSYMTWGQSMAHPEVGCLVVFPHHVAFVVGKDERGNILALGGNQSDEVNIRAFSTSRIAVFRWPLGVPLPSPTPLPLLASTSLSAKET